MDKDRIAGSAKQVKGTVKQAVISVTAIEGQNLGGFLLSLILGFPKIQPGPTILQTGAKDL